MSEPTSLERSTATAAPLIERRLRDARHAADNAALADANARMSELKEVLLAILAEARGRFYVESFGAQWAELDPAIVDPAVGPTEEGRDAAQRADIIGEDQADILERVVEQARRELILAAAATVNRPLTQPDAYRNWEIRQNNTILLAVTMALGNAKVALHQAVGRLLIRPELR